MLKRIRAGISQWRERRAGKRAADSWEPVFYDERTTTDTVVFVHGIFGHFRDTWKRFPELLHLDPDLPRTDILLWGYRSNALPSVNAVKTEAQRLMSDMRVVLADAEHIFFVGHSMGGLTILNGLVEELRDGRATSLPLNVVRHVALYATPAMGSEIASVVRLSLGILPVVRLLVNPQIRDLSTGEFVQTLIREVVKRIYNPTIAPEEAASKRHIPITACVGTRDRAVTGTSALAIFERNPPIYLDADHGSIKEPSSRRDRRYLALKNILVAHYSTWFRETAEQCLDGSAPKSAAGSLFMRCEHALEARLLARPDLAYAAKPAGKQRALKIRLLRLAVELTREMPTQPLGTILNAALVGL